LGRRIIVKGFVVWTKGRHQLLFTVLMELDAIDGGFIGLMVEWREHE
jgi:hypothetical protein